MKISSVQKIFLVVTRTTKNKLDEEIFHTNISQHYGMRKFMICASEMMEFDWVVTQESIFKSNTKHEATSEIDEYETRHTHTHPPLIPP